MLSDDTCRCHNDRCEKHETCQRWLQRAEFRKVGEMSWISHSTSVCADGEFDYYIGVNDEV